MSQRQFETTGSVDVSESLDLEECHNDPIHRTIHVQPHGVYLQFDAETLAIQTASQNVSQHFPGQTAEQLLGASLKDFLDGSPVQRIRSELTSYLDHPVRWSTDLAIGRAVLSLLPEADTRTRALEIEPSEETDPSTDGEFERNQILNNLRALSERNRIFNMSVNMVRDQTRFDRVMLYRFNAEGHGEVVAESRREGIGSYLGQQFPASDIPEPARRIYRKTDFRLIPQVDYEPVPVIAASGPARDLDLTYSSLRNVPRVHRQYLKNMEVSSSFSVPVISGGDLWGLIACHGQSRNQLPWAVRLFCSNIGSLLSSQIDRLKARRTRQHRREISRLRDRFLEDTPTSPRLFETVSDRSRELLQVLDAVGFYILRGDESAWITDAAMDPPPDRLLRWIQNRLGEEKLLTVSSLEESFEGSWQRSGEISGLLAVRLTSSDDFCAWFRPEYEHKITWGGDPREPAVVDDSGELNPRRSFEEWTQIVAGTCKRWSDRDTWTAEEFVHTFNQISLREQHQRIREINEELAEANEQKAQLMQELHHRVKNNFQVTISLINIHKNQVEDPAAQQLLENLRNKLHSLVALHDSLSTSDRHDQINMASYLGDLVSHLRQSPLPSNQSFVLETDLEEITLSMGQALACALIVNELVSNALEHGLPEEGPSRVTVSLNRSTDGRCELSVHDTGPGLPEPLDELAERSLGLKIVRSLAEGQLGGTVKTVNQDGAKITAEFQPESEKSSD